MASDNKPSQTVGDSSGSSRPDSAQEFKQLAHEHAAGMYVISYAITEESNSAREAVIAVLATVYSRMIVTGHLPKHQTLYELIVKESRRKPAHAPVTIPASETGTQERRIWSVIDGFGWRERLLCAIHFVLEWSATATADLLNVSEGAIQAQLAIFEQRFTQALALKPEKPGLTHNIRQIASETIRRRYSRPDWSPQDIELIIDQARQQAQSQRERPWLRRSLRWLVIGGAAVIFALIVLGVIIIATLGPLTTFPGPNAQPTPFGAIVTPIQPVRQANPLSWLSDSGTIQQRMRESADLWHTLYLDVQTIQYGPSEYIGAARIYRSQAWVNKPGQSIQLFGLLFMGPNSAYIFENGRNYYLNPITKDTYSHEVSSTPETLIENYHLRQMIFPQVSRWNDPSSNVQVYNTANFLGRSVVIVDWFNKYGERESRLWIDDRTGVVLRWEEYGGPDFNLLISDSSITDIAYDQSFPPAELIDSIRRIDFSSISSLTSAHQILQPTPTLAMVPDKRTALPSSPAPANLDLTTSNLTFQFSNNLEVTNVQTGTARLPIRLFANGYSIGESEFGLPWMLRCKRSPEGYRLAFNTGSDETAAPDDSLRWLDLREPGKIYQPLRSLHTSDFSFSGDGHQLAAIARGDDPALSGIYLVEIATGESRLVTHLADGNSLVWSPDGEFLALVGMLDAGSEREVIVAHVRTGKIAFRARLPDEEGLIPSNWPIANWGVDFPQKTGGMEICSQAPAK